jgi:HSP20 family protein
MEINKKGYCSQTIPIEIGTRNLYNYLSIEVSRKDYILSETSFVLIDIYETQDNLYVEADVPGIKAEDIHLYIEGGLLIIEGVKEDEMRHSEEIVNFLCMERSLGLFKRIINIPSAVNTDKIKAFYGEGTLTICLPKNIERRRGYKRIDIE